MTSLSNIGRDDQTERQKCHRGQQSRDEVADILAEALWTILLREGKLTAGERSSSGKICNTSKPNGFRS